MTKVELLQADDHRKGVQQAVEALGERFVDTVHNAKRILLKVHFTALDSQLGATSAEAVRGMMDVIRQYSRAEVYIGDASSFGTAEAFRQFGYEQLPMEYAYTFLVDLNNDAYVDGFTVRTDGTQNQIRRSRLASLCDVGISLAPMNPRGEAAWSLAVENWALGTWLVPPRAGPRGMTWTREPWLDGAEGLHASVAALYGQLPCQVAIVDGVEAIGAVLAGYDAVAVDAVALTLMDIDPASIGYLQIAMEQGLGTMDMAKIDVPPLLVSELCQQFKHSI